MQAIHGIQPPSKLEAIINDGLQRIDDAVEEVIERRTVQPGAIIRGDKPAPYVMNKMVRGEVDRQIEAMRGRFTINTDVMVQGNIDPNTGIPRYHKALPHEIERQAQRKRNYETALRNEMNNIFGAGFI